MSQIRRIAFPKASKALELLLNGKTPKQALDEINMNHNAITTLKNMFPLFLGLPRGYIHRGRGDTHTE